MRAMMDGTPGSLGRRFRGFEIPRFAAVKNSPLTAYVRGDVFHAVRAPHRGMTTRNDTVLAAAIDRNDTVSAGAIGAKS